MSNRVPMNKTLPYPDTRTVPESTSGEVQPRPDSGDAKIALHIVRFAELTRGAVQKWGGQASLAALLGKSEGDICDRLNRKVVKGALMRPFNDYEAIATTHPDAAEFFLFGLCDLLGYEHPKKKRKKTIEEKYEALVRRLRLAGELGEHAIKSAAMDLGADASEYE